MIKIAKDERGVYCGVIDKQLIVATCPLPQGACMWKHRINGLCMYDEHFADQEPKPTSLDFAKLVGAPVVPKEVVNKLRDDLAAKIKNDML
jgi:hypothetical protein